MGFPVRKFTYAEGRGDPVAVGSHVVFHLFSRALDRGSFGGIERFVAGGLLGQPLCLTLKLVRIILSGWWFGMMLIFGYLL
jgi:hypothetical protein